jgi:putative endonuclease
MTRGDSGKIGERIAAAYLRAKGYEIVAANYRIRGGEIDIVARKREYTVFVEVKYRKNSFYAHPREAVSSGKQSRVKLAALQFIAENDASGAFRFDVIEITGVNECEVTHIEDAFQ